MSIPQLPPKRRTLQEQLDRLVDMPEADLIKLMDELEADEESAKGHRHHAPRPGTSHLASTVEKNGQAHETAKAEQLAAVAAVRDLGISFTIHEPELRGPVPHETLPGVVYGYWGNDEIPPRFQGYIRYGVPESNEIPAHLRGLVKEESFPPAGISSDSEIPEHLRGLVKLEELVPRKRKLIRCSRNGR